MNQLQLSVFENHFKNNEPKLYQFIIDFLDNKVSNMEMVAFSKLTHEEKQLYLDNYFTR